MCPSFEDRRRNRQNSWYDSTVNACGSTWHRAATLRTSSSVFGGLFCPTSPHLKDPQTVNTQTRQPHPQAMATTTSEPTATADATSPPPSPLPVLAEDATPGARATALQTAFAKALEATLNKCSYANFASCFPTPAQYRPQTLEMFHKDFTGRLHEVCTVRWCSLEI